MPDPNCFFIRFSPQQGRDVRKVRRIAPQAGEKPLQRPEVLLSEGAARMTANTHRPLLFSAFWQTHFPGTKNSFRSLINHDFDSIKKDVCDARLFCESFAIAEWNPEDKCANMVNNWKLNHRLNWEARRRNRRAWARECRNNKYFCLSSDFYGQSGAREALSSWALLVAPAATGWKRKFREHAETNGKRRQQNELSFQTILRRRKLEIFENLIEFKYLTLKHESDWNYLQCQKSWETTFKIVFDSHLSDLIQSFSKILWEHSPT